MLARGDIKRIYQRYGEGESAKALADEYGTDQSSISRIIRGEVWADVTGGRNISRREQSTAYRVAHIQARWDQGCHVPEILAQELGISRQAVYKIMTRHHVGRNASC